jgi:autotransporter-associated beta strand protein
MNSNAGGVTVNGNNWLRIAVSQTWVNNSTNAFINNANIINGAVAGVPTVTLTGTGNFALGTLNQTTGTNNYAVSMTSNGTVLIGLSDSRGRITLNSGRLGLSAGNSLGSSGFGNLVINGGTLQAQVNTTIANSNNITISNSFTYGSSDRPNRILNTGIGAVSLSNSATIDTFSGDLQLGGVIGDGGNARGITKAGAGTLTLVAANTFSGGTTNSAGILILSNSLALQNSALDTSNSITGDTTNGIRATTTALTLGGLAGNKNLADVFTTTSGGYGSVTALTLNPGTGASNNYSGVIANGAMTLTKNGAGTQTFSGGSANTYSGLTTISNGTLNLNKTAGVNAIAGNVTVNSNAILLLSVSDQVTNTSAVTLSGGTIQRGSGVTETFGNLTLTAASFINFGTGTTNSLNFSNYTGGGNKLNVTNFLVGNILTFKTDLTTTISNTSLFGFDNAFNSGWNGSTFTITAIPEPSTILAAIGLAGAFAWPLRRHLLARRRSAQQA